MCLLLVFVSRVKKVVVRNDLFIGLLLYALSDGSYPS